MSSRRLEWVVAGSLAAWAAARVTGADRLELLEAAAAPALSFTPQAVAGAWLAALLLRGRGARGTAALAGAALTAVVAPRAMPHRQPLAGGLALRILTANLLVGRASEEDVVELVRRTRADVLLAQELTEDAATRLKRAGLGDVLPNEITDVRGNSARGSGIYARYPLSEGPVMAPTTVAQPTARLDLPSGQSAHLVCVHLRPPSPPWSRHAAGWRREMALLPPPGAPVTILAGDFNGTVDHVQFRRLLRLGYLDAAGQAGRGLVPTWGPEPRGRPALLSIDHILVDPRCAVRAVSVHKLPGSDHRAVYAELRLPS